MFGPSSYNGAGAGRRIALKDLKRMVNRILKRASISLKSGLGKEKLIQLIFCI